jgi:transcriptional regulator with XRE-family HTH domain
MSNRTPTIATKMRYFAGSFWTPDTDTRLQRLEAQGLSAAKIAAKLGVSRNSVIARSQRLSDCADYRGHFPHTRSALLRWCRNITGDEIRWSAACLALKGAGFAMKVE